MWSYCPAVPQGHSKKFQKVYVCVCVCVWGGGRSINGQFTWMYYHCMMKSAPLCCMERGLGPCMISITGVQTCYTSYGAEGGGKFFLPIYIHL